MKYLMPPDEDKLEDSVILDTDTEFVIIKLWGVERAGVIIDTWTGSGGDLNLDVQVSSEPLTLETPVKFQSVLETVIDDDDIVQITSICANWMRITGVGSTWAADTVQVDYVLKAKNFG